MSETKLLPCPFCGGEAEVCGYYFIQCTKCGSSTLTHTNIEKAIQAWNNRKPIDDIVERLETLAEKAMKNSEKAAELGHFYEKHMIFNGAKGTAFEKAIEIVKEGGRYV